MGFSGARKAQYLGPMAESGGAPPKRAQADAPLGMTKRVMERAPDETTADTLLGRSGESSAPAVQPESAQQTDRIEELHSDTLPRVGRYVLLRKLGEGGMGVVYAAYDQELDRKVALKIIHPQKQQDQELRTRIFREAQALARVSAPNVVHVYQVGEVDGQLFIAMEFVNGTTLSKWQSDPAHSWQDVLRMYIAAGQGLQAAHEAGLVHRDPARPFMPSRNDYRTAPGKGCEKSRRPSAIGAHSACSL